MKLLGDRKRAPRRRLLSYDELALWRHATADVNPRVRNGAVEARAEPEPPAASSSEAGKASKRKPEPAPSAAKPPVTPAISPIAPLDRRLKRRLSSGKADVDDVIDLHGMT